MGMSAVYARNVAFESSARRPVVTGDDDDSAGGMTELDGGPTTRTDNEYEYVWDASALAARGARAGQLQQRGTGKTTETGSSVSASTSFGGRPSDQCRCMTETMRTMPRQVSSTSSADSSSTRYSNDKPSSHTSRLRVDAGQARKAVTLGRFGHLESRSAARSAAGPIKSHRQGRVDELPRRVCPHCGHQSSSTPADGSACGAGTPPSRLDTSMTLPRRQNIHTVSHKRI